MGNSNRMDPGNLSPSLSSDERLVRDAESGELLLVMSPPYGSADEVMVEVGGYPQLGPSGQVIQAGTRKVAVSEWKGNEDYPADDRVVDCVLLDTIHSNSQADGAKWETEYTFPVSRLEHVEVVKIDPDPEYEIAEFTVKRGGDDEGSTFPTMDRIRSHLQDVLECPPEEILVISTADSITVKVALVAVRTSTLDRDDVFSEVESLFPDTRVVGDLSLEFVPRSDLVDFPASNQ